jgi:hypothetical protein
MENKVIVLNKDGQWWELTNYFLVGASEQPDKTMYRSAYYISGQQVTREELLTRAQQYLDELKKKTK